MTTFLEYWKSIHLKEKESELKLNLKGYLNIKRYIK